MEGRKGRSSLEKGTNVPQAVAPDRLCSRSVGSPQAHREIGVGQVGMPSPSPPPQPAMRIRLLAGLFGAPTHSLPICVLSLCLAGPAFAQGGNTALTCETAAAPGVNQPNREAALFIPNNGTIHALVVYIQQAQDTFRDCIDTQLPSTDPGHNLSNQYDTYCAGAPPTGRYQSRTEDQATEWPAFRMVNGVPTQVLPNWANRVIDVPGTAPSAYQVGSLSHFFWEMSRGTFKLEGRVYPDLITVQSSIPQGNMIAPTLEVLQRLRTVPHGLDFHEFDRYDNATGLYTPDADGDGEPDGDGIFDMLIVMPRTGGAIATLGYGLTEDLGGVSVRGGLPDSSPHVSGVYSAGFTFHRQVALAAHEVGHFLFGLGHPCDTDTSPSATGDLTSLMCGPRFRRMSAPDRIRLSWLTPRLVTVPASTSFLTLDPSPTAGDAIRITQNGVPAAGDVLVEARSFNDVWDGISPVADGDVDDQPFLVREGLVVHQIGPTVTTPYAAHARYSSMDNTGVRARRDMDFGAIYNARVAGVEPPHVGYAPGDAFTPLSRFRFDFRGGPLDSRVAITNIVVAPSAVSFTLWDHFLTAEAERAVQTNYTLANHAAGTGYLADRNRARTDDFTFGGTLRLGGTHGRIVAGTPTIALLSRSRLVVASTGAVALWGPNGYTFPVTAEAGARVEAYGALHAEHVAFSAINPADGWSGVFIGPDPAEFRSPTPLPESDLLGVSVTGVRFVPDPEVRYLYPPGGAVMVQNRIARIGAGSLLSGAVFSNGLYVTGSTARVTISGQSSMEDNDGFGVLATAGGRVSLLSETEVRLNDWGGVRLDGYGSRATLDGAAQVVDNVGPGLAASNQAHASVRSPGGATNTSVSDNDGGPTALAGASVDGGQCRPLGGATGPNRFERNYLGFYDARAEGGSTVAARDAFWGPGRTALVLVKDLSSTIDVFPLAPTPTSPSSSSCNISTERTAQPSSLARQVPSSAVRGGTPSATVVALATEARQAAWAGATDVAFATLALATEAIVTEDDREAVFEATAALLADDRPAAVVTALQADAAGTGDVRPWARRALAVAYASGGDPTGADALALSLTTGDAGTAHALFGHALRVRLAVEADSAELAFARLADLEAVVTPLDTAAVETFGTALALVVAAFPDAASAGARTANASAEAAVASKATATGAFVDGVDVWPNPAAGRVSVQVSLNTSAATATASVYDVLGRRVHILHDGPLAAGAHPLTFDAATLAPGLYIVRVAVTPEGGARWTETRRVTVTR